NRGYVRPTGIGPPIRCPFCKLTSGHGTRDPKSLGDRTSKTQKHEPMIDRLNSFGDGLTPKGIGKNEDTFQNRQVLWVIEHVVHKALIDFQNIDRQSLQI